MDASEEMSGRWLFDVILGALFIGLLLYMVSNSYMIDKTVVYYKTLDLSFALSSALAVPAAMVVKLAHPLDDELIVKVDEQKNILEISKAKFKLARLHNIQHRFFHRADTDIFVRSNMLLFSKARDVEIGKYENPPVLCPVVKITKEIVIIPKSKDDEKVAKIIERESPKTKIVHYASQPKLEDDVLNIFVSEGDKELTYAHDPLLAPYACHIAEAMGVVALPSGKEGIEIKLREEDIGSLTAVFKGI